MADYQFIPDLILRIPLLSFERYSADNIQEIVGDPQFQYAIYLANPALHQLLLHKHFDISTFNDKELLSIQKYINRTCFRPTPFGCFASSTVVDWGQDDQILLKDKTHDHIHLLLDQEISLLLAKKLLKDNPYPRQLSLNPTIYRLKKSYRFVKTTHQEGVSALFFTLDSIKANKFIDSIVKLFKKGPLPEAQLLSIITGWGFQNTEAAEFLNRLLTSQILTTQLEPNLLGEDYLYRLINTPSATANPLLLQLNTLYKKLNAAKPFAQEVLQEFDNEIKQLTADCIKKNSVNFYSNLERKKLSGSLNIKYQEQISTAITALRILVPYASPQNLKDFITGFKTRFEGQKVPLLLALDPDAGIAYGGASGSDRGPLLSQVKFNPTAKSSPVMEWTMVHQLLLQLWTNNTNREAYASIELNPSHLSKLDKATYPLPPSMMVMFREFDDQIFIENAGGCSGTSIIGRFTLFNDEVLDLSTQIAQIEEQANPDVIFADIGILSDTHTDNINRRYPVYPYEIPINSVPVQLVSHQIALSDLLVSVVKDEVVLESVSLQKVIQPRLSSAYNYVHNHLSIFKFLCDLQYQGIQNNLTFDLEYYFPGLKFYPRVSMGSIILSAAKWYLATSDIDYLNKATKKEGLDKILDIKQQISLPDLICLTRADQQLVFNLTQKQEVLLLLNCIAGAEQVKLQEYFLPNAAQSKVVIAGKPMVNQFITFLYKTNSVYPVKFSPQPASNKKIKREFALGSEWLYFKIYCSPQIADHLLSDQILPLMVVLEKKEVSSWFFIRYQESGYHLRLRLKVNPTDIGQVMIKLNNQLAISLQSHEIKKLQTDTYIREIERYGADMITLVEDFFYASSKLVIHFIKNREPGYSNHSLAIMDIDQLMRLFMPTVTDQISFLQLVADNFHQEFSGNKALKIDLDMKYRELRTEIQSLLNDPHYFKKLKLGKYHREFLHQAGQIANVASHFTAERRLALLADMIHMHFNRLFTEDEREQEYIIYYCMLKYKLSVKARL
ncbi:thiopeptide-type bacteriocin biosynthesis domain-containing protein [Mucilaginibacter lappiensis]|uniref:Thiopeptide-type bacteriocin biosynthesis protein n=1 Tax=Mucilaginibacter lappiensis TaxID=354630 RepID=A0ABR6PPC5_9SPHI|nr:lantibiotic dehydratase [Mucilaginibacter lappiensis]MBB6111622.1 thiopeptide-type bacteriocin biosynthesis protein [Mucilaginibacter lappiensis]SIR84419.1 thiopeptide-type bacteriocin biosynthesis domain-containing protein [Mucilaginibacter lappiensis]